MSTEDTDSTSPDNKRENLRQFQKKKEDLKKRWWFFPEEPESKVHGFLGTGKIFIVGDQPSCSDWGPDDEGRRLFYGLLKEMKAGNCHLTDLYKRRGCTRELKYAVNDEPQNRPDFRAHVKEFLWELELLAPSTVLALGGLSFDLLSKYTPELKQRGIALKQVYHFAWPSYAKGLQEKRDLISRFNERLTNAISEAR